MSVDIHCCFQCKDRKPLCHSNCERYAAMREVRDAVAADNARETLMHGHYLQARKNFYNHKKAPKDQRHGQSGPRG